MGIGSLLSRVHASGPGGLPGRWEGRVAGVGAGVEGEDWG